MTNFFQKLFSGIDKTSKFPKILWGHRFEGIEYHTAKASIYIDSTFLGGRKIFTDSIRAWKHDEAISQPDKAIIFKEVLEFANGKGNEKPMVVINIDYEKDFWEALCKESSELIKEIQYDSDKQKKDFQYNYMLDSVRKNGILIVDDKTIKTETEFLKYWNNRNN